VRVLLVTMPFAALDRPSLALGLLAAQLRHAGIDCDTAYLNLAFCSSLGVEAYDQLAQSMPPLVMAADWAFTACLYDGSAPGADSYIAGVLRAKWRQGRDQVEAVLAARSLAPRFLSRVMADLPWPEYDLVGFTCSHGQTIASLALAKLAKEHHGRLLTVFGGPAWHGIMGRTLVESFPFVDAACTGEGDVALLSFVQALAGQGLVAPGQVAGMIVRDSSDAVGDRGPEPLRNLDELPIPDYTDYLSALGEHGSFVGDGPVILAETSRGCWWAAREPCRFCGINGPHRAFRAKSAGRILTEFRALAAHPGCRLLEIVDNVASPQLLSTVLPQLAEDPLPVPLFLEVRPDVSRRTIELLAEANASTQTGIESFSGRLLSLMNKGTRVLDNVRFLRWCKTFGVQVHWNLLYGFPGETTEDYAEITDVLEGIGFLPPPDAFGRIELERFSTYFEDPGSHGFVNVRPAAAYSYLFPFGKRTLSDIAYFFEYDYAPGLEPPLEAHRLFRLVKEWRAESRGVLRLGGGGKTLIDARRLGETKTHALDQLERLLYSACEDPRSRSELCELVCSTRTDGVGLTERIDCSLASFVERGLMVRSGDRFLSLALPEPL
jgi:ribosomal peptide maturation radical SAM protein 1